MPPAYFPSIGYMALLTAAESVMIETHDTYPKHTCRNRCTILSAQGPLNISIPVSKPYGSRSKTSDILIFETHIWPKKHWRAIESAYNKSPYFFHYAERIKGVVFSSKEDLLHHNMYCLDVMLDIIGAKADVQLTSNYIKDNENVVDARNFEKFMAGVGDHYFDRYIQVFADRHPFHNNLSIIDLICNAGPQSSVYIEKAAGVIRDKLF